MLLVNVINAILLVVKKINILKNFLCSNAKMQEIKIRESDPCSENTRKILQTLQTLEEKLSHYFNVLQELQQSVEELEGYFSEDELGGNGEDDEILEDSKKKSKK